MGSRPKKNQVLSHRGKTLGRVKMAALRRRPLTARAVFTARPGANHHAQQRGSAQPPQRTYGAATQYLMGAPPQTHIPHFSSTGSMHRASRAPSNIPVTRRAPCYTATDRLAREDLRPRPGWVRPQPVSCPGASRSRARPVLVQAVVGVGRPVPRGGSPSS